MTELSPREARRILRREILRRSRLPLLVVGVLIAAGLAFFAKGHPMLTMTFQGIPGNVASVDGTLRLVLILGALALPLALMHGENVLQPLLRRLPVAPTAALRVRLELALICGLAVLGAAFTVEYFAAPDMLRPSFPSRLNPIEHRTLSHLPGVPLLRFDIDGQAHRGLTAVGSLAAMQKDGVWAYGEHLLWPDLQSLEVPTPGKMITRLDAAAWTAFSPFEKHRLARLGVPEGATVEVTLERFVSREEYTSQPWRRDGLQRDRRWHAVDRAVGFLALLAVALSLSAMTSHLVSTLPALYLLALIPIGLYPGALNGKPTLLFTDLDRGEIFRELPTLPTLPLLHHPLEPWIWPVFLCLLGVLIYALAAKIIQHMFQGKAASLRRGPATRTLRALSPTERLGLYCVLLCPLLVFLLAEGDTKIFSKGKIWLYLALGLVLGVFLVLFRVLKQRPGRAAKILKALLLFFATLLFLWFVLPIFNSAYLTGLWINSLFLACLCGVYPPILWARREALLSRLPVHYTRVANRRLILVSIALIGLALIPVASEVLPDRSYSAEESNFGGERFCADDARFLELFGAVPLLRAAEESFESFSQNFHWEDASRRPFLPRGYLFRFHFEHLAENGGRDSLRIGEQVGRWGASLEVVDLLRSREDVKAFLAGADFDQLGPVPGSRWLQRSLIVVVAGLLSFCLALLMSSPKMAALAAVLVNWLFSGVFFGGLGALEVPASPGAAWWLMMTLILIGLATTAHTLIRRRLALGGSLLPALRRWLGRRWQKLWDATDARPHGVARNV